ncbi:MAG TPA: hypothetical protein VKB50_12190 [Vicinamibacterales bacterium]|nr:hypothetical protein [Vicinamibacterales bacterium]
MRLTNVQQAAWRHIGETVRRYQEKGQASLSQVLSSGNCRECLFDAAIESVRQHARVVLHFHPDRIGVKPITVAEALSKKVTIGVNSKPASRAVVSRRFPAERATPGKRRSLGARTIDRIRQSVIGQSTARWS